MDRDWSLTMANSRRLRRQGWLWVCPCSGKRAWNYGMLLASTCGLLLGKQPNGLIFLEELLEERRVLLSPCPFDSYKLHAEHLKCSLCRDQRLPVVRLVW